MSTNQPFITSIKVLFDILDINRSGFVFLSDIEQYWDEYDNQILPPNIVPCLRQFADNSGMLNFDDFVQGLQLAMSAEKRQEGTRVKTEMFISPDSRGQRPITDSGYQSRQILSPDEWQRNQELGSSYLNGVTSQRQRDSPPTRPRQYDDSDWRALLPKTTGQTRGEPIAHAPAQTRKYRPPTKDYCEELSPTSTGSSGRPKSPRRAGSDDNISPRGLSMTPPSKSSQSGQYQRVRETRRHTLQTGVDFNVVKAIKQLEQERDVFLQAMELLEQTRGWLEPHLHNVRDRQKQFSSTGRMETKDSAYDPNFILPRVNVVTQILQGLMEGSNKGFPHPEHSESTLLSQNKQMKQALLESEARIKQLEDEKIQLVREIFEDRSKRRPMTEDSLM